jgi:perosamine synthetase
LELFETVITEQAKHYVKEVLDSGFVSEGSYVQKFEDRLTQIFGYDYAVAVNSCTSALHLALILSGVGEGDEVILPAQTFVATGHTILYQGATPVFADINPNTGNIEEGDITRLITPRTKAIIAVAWGGNPPGLTTLSGICRKYGLKLIQDNAQALGAWYEGEPVTRWGDFSCFSFQAIKHVTAGDGGLLVCNNRIDYENAQRLRWFDIDRMKDLPDATGERLYNLKRIGYKYHMNNISAALGLGNLVGVHWRIARRENIAKIYDSQIKRVDISFMDREGSSNWLYTINVHERDRFIEKMNSLGIPASVVHVGIDRNELFGGIRKELQGQRYFDKHHVCLPIHSSLTDEDILKVVDAVMSGW